MLESFFRMKEKGSNVRTEIIAGFTTFVTMAYIIIVNPAILKIAGIPEGPSMVATILSAFFGTMIMGIYAKRPFAIAPYMGENAFVAYTVTGILGYPWQTALGAIFIGGVLFTLLTIFRLRTRLAEAIPQSLKYGFAVGIGLFLTFIGLNETGIVELGVAGAPVHVGELNRLKPLLAVFCFLLIAILMMKKIKGAILAGIIATTLVSFLTGASPVPERFLSLPPSLSPIFLKLDISGALTWGFVSVILVVFVMDFVDTMGTLIGVSARAGFLDENGNLPDVEKPMLADALATIVGSCLGTTTTGTYIESAAGIEEGGRTGLASVVTALLFLLSLFFSPFYTAVPPHAYGAALIVVGLLMVEPVTRIDFRDYAKSIPSFATIILMSFTFNIGIGMTAGFVLYPLFSVISGRAREVHPGLWVLFFLSLLFYIFYPY